MRYRPLPANCASPAGTPFTDTARWWSTGFPDSEPPWRTTSSSAVPGAVASTPVREKLSVLVAPEARASQSHGSGASRRPGR
jgi:hypothetical protein